MEDLRLNQCGWGQFGGVAQLSSPFQALLAFLNPINAIAIDAQIGDSRRTRKTPLVLRTRPGTLWPFALLSAIAFVQPATGAPGWNVGPPGKPQAQSSDKTKSDAKSKAASKPDPRPSLKRKSLKRKQKPSPKLQRPRRHPRQPRRRPRAHPRQCRCRSRALRRAPHAARRSPPRWPKP